MNKNHYGKIDTNVMNISHTQLYIFIKEYCIMNSIENPRILEIGCASGYFSELLRSNGMYVFDIEPTTSEAFENGRVNDFYHGTIEEFCKDITISNQYLFDIIVLDDVIEHLSEPRGVLKDISRFLQRHGIIVALITNIAHKGICEMLRDGQWIYQKYGIPESTHLRFFSWHSLRQMFIDIGFGIDKRYDVKIPGYYIYPVTNLNWNTTIQRIIRNVKKSLPIFIKNKLKKFIFHQQKLLNSHIIKRKLRNNTHEDSETLKFVIRASRQSLAANCYVDSYPNNILVITTDDPNSPLVDIRLKTPLEFYASEVGGVIHIKNGYSIAIDDIYWADVIIVHREITQQIINIVQFSYNLGIAIIYDTDDNLFELPKYSMNALDRDSLARMRYICSIADRVTCPVEPLKDYLYRYSNNVYIVPNIIKYQKVDIIIEDKQSDKKCTLIIAASDTVITDFLLDALDMVCQKNNNIHIIVIGNIAGKFNKIRCSKKLYGTCTQNKFFDIINSHENGVGLIPLTSTLFDSCKSPIKYFHYTSAGIVTVASNVLPYKSIIKSDINGILVENDPNMWACVIENLCDNVQRRQFLLKNALKTWEKYGAPHVAVQGWCNVLKNTPKSYVKSLQN